jgi:hypothetical protein
MDSGVSVVEIDLSQFSHGATPPASQIHLKVTASIFGWLLLLGLLIKIGAGTLAIMLGLASFVGVAIVFVVISASRTRQSTIGDRISTIKPEYENARLPQFDHSLGEIARTVEAAVKETAPAVPTTQLVTQAGPRRKSVIYIVLGTVLFVVGMTILFALKAGGALLSVAIVLLISGMYALFTRSRRVLQPSATTVVANDPRRPILFLRSFRDDMTGAPLRVTLAGIRWWGSMRLEEALSETVGKLGPFLAVGEPNEGLPQLGAARAYLGQDAWQEAVLGWIRTSRLIIMLAGPTSWIHWEMQHIIRSGRLQKLLLVLPPGRTVAGTKVAIARQQRWDNIVRSLEETPLGESLKRMDISNLLMVQFRPGGMLVFRSRSDLVQDYDLALMLAIYGVLFDRKDEPIVQSASVLPPPESPPLSPSPLPLKREPMAAVPERVAAAWFGLLGFAAGSLLALLGDSAQMHIALPRALIMGMIIGGAVAIGMKFIMRCDPIEAGTFFALAGGAMLVGEFVIVVADPWRSNLLLILFIKALEPAIILAGGWRLYSLFRERAVWMVVLGTNALVALLAHASSGVFPLFSLYVLPSAAFCASIGYALARERR